jgi:hypothetical protein
MFKKTIVLCVALISMHGNGIFNISPEMLHSIYGFSKDVLKPCLISPEYFSKNNFDWWSNPIYRGITVSSLDDYIIARSRIFANSAIIKSLHSSVESKSYILGLISPLKPELSNQLDECAKLMYSDDPQKFLDCNAKSKKMALEAIEKTFRDMDDQVKEAHKYKMQVTADSENVARYEAEYEPLHEEMHAVVKEVEKNTEYYKNTKERKECPQLFNLAKRMALYKKTGKLDASFEQEESQNKKKGLHDEAACSQAQKTS